MLKLVLPSKKYIKEGIAAIKERYKEGEISLKDFNNEMKKRKNASAFLKKLKDEKNGINLEKGRVAQIIYWLIDDKKYVGRLHLRKKLNKQLRVRGGNVGYEIRPSERKKGYGAEILRLGLLKAKAQGFKKILIDCRESNIASKKIIEANGGIFIDRMKVEGEGPASINYYINIK